MPPSEGVGVYEAARMLGVTVDQVYRLIYSGRLVASKVGRSQGQGPRRVWTISPDAIRAYAKRVADGCIRKVGDNGRRVSRG